jgi:hypothetical protein
VQEVVVDLSRRGIRSGRADEGGDVVYSQAVMACRWTSASVTRHPLSIIILSARVSWRAHWVGLASISEAYTKGFFFLLWLGASISISL